MTGSMRLISPADAVISHVVGLKAVEEVTPEAAAAVAEPEVRQEGQEGRGCARGQEGRQEEEVVVRALAYCRSGQSWPRSTSVRYHNLGFLTIDRLAERNRHKGKPDRFEGAAGGRFDWRNGSAAGQAANVHEFERVFREDVGR